MNGVKNQKTLWIVAIFTLTIFSPILPIAFAQPITWNREIIVTVGNLLVIKSDQRSIQQVFLQGNLTVANYTKSAQYPSDAFTITAFNPGIYNLRILFDLQTNYKVNLYISRAYFNDTTYYLSGGPSELDLKVTFIPAPPPVLSNSSPESGIRNWINKFGQAFPLWVKLLYLTFGLQFFAVGGLWIRRETARRESTPHGLDAGEKAFLWLDIVYKFLLTSLVVLVTVMGGEFVILFLLRFMFLINLNFLSLWDIFVVGFAFGLVAIFYIIRFTLERLFDLKPLEDE